MPGGARIGERRSHKAIFRLRRRSPTLLGAFRIGTRAVSFIATVTLGEVASFGIGEGYVPAERPPPTFS